MAGIPLNTGMNPNFMMQQQQQQHPIQQPSQQMFQQQSNPQQQILPPQQQQPPPAQAQQNLPPGMQPTSAAPSTDQQKLDHLSKVKTLIWPLKESLANAIKSAAQNFHQNGMVDIGNLKGTDVTVPRFDKQLEEFYSVCDQIELNLLEAIACASQWNSSQRHLPTPVQFVRQDAVMTQDAMTYSNYITVARSQVSYVKDIIDALNETVQNLTNE